MRLSNVVLMLIVVLLILMVGCGSIIDRLTPADVPQRATKYINADPNLAGLSSLYTAKDIRRELGIFHRDRQIDLKRLAEDDQNHYQDAIEVIDFNIAESQALQDAFLNGNTTWPGMHALLLGAGGLLAGRNFLKRPGDLSPTEAKQKATEPQSNTSA